MSQKKLAPAMGNWVDGDKFWNRTTEMEMLVHKIQQDANLLLVAQRRMGKTSLLHETKRRLSDTRHVLFLDLESAKNTGDVIAKLALETNRFKSIWAKTQTVFKNVLGKVEGVGISELEIQLRAGIASSSWDAQGDELFNMLASANKPVLLLLDEVPIFVQNLLSPSDSRTEKQGHADADHFLSWLRANLLKHQGKVTSIITGSIGLAPVLNRVGLSATVNHLESFPLPPWDRDTSIACIQALAHHDGFVLEEGVPEKMLELLGVGIPHYVQKFYISASDECRRQRRTEILLEDIGTVYDKRMLDPSLVQADMSSYEERLQRVLGDDWLPLALEFLTEAAMMKRGLTEKAITSIQDVTGFEQYNDVALKQAVLDILIHDGYLELEQNRYVFVSNLLRDWWKRRYGMKYVSIQTRAKQS